MAESAAMAAETEKAVCIETGKITDSFRDKDYIEDLRVYLTRESQETLDHATGARARYAELLFVSIGVEAIPFQRGHYSVDLTYYYRILADAVMGTSRPAPIAGLSVFSKRLVMFGGECGAKRFSSGSVPGCAEGCAHIDRTCPEAVVEALDPMILSAKVVDPCNCCRCDPEPAEMPEDLFTCFDGELLLNAEGRRFYVSLGQFSMIRMQRGAQLLLPAAELCIPSQESHDGGCAAEEADPAELFGKVEFPLDRFFPARDPA